MTAHLTLRSARGRPPRTRVACAHGTTELEAAAGEDINMLVRRAMPARFLVCGCSVEDWSIEHEEGPAPRPRPPARPPSPAAPRKASQPSRLPPVTPAGRLDVVVRGPGDATATLACPHGSTAVRARAGEPLRELLWRSATCRMETCGCVAGDVDLADERPPGSGPDPRFPAVIDGYRGRPGD